MKILIDTNVLLSAALRERLPERVVLFVAERDDLRRIVTPDIQAEYSDVLRRPKFAMDDETLDQWNTLLAMRAIDVGQPPQSRQFPRDPEDAPFLAAALSRRCRLHDHRRHTDLLDHRDVIPTRIVTVAKFAAEFGIT